LQLYCSGIQVPLQPSQASQIKCTHFGGEHMVFTPADDSDSEACAEAAGRALAVALPELQAVADLPDFYIFSEGANTGSAESFDEWPNLVKLGKGQVLMQLPKLRALHVSSAYWFEPDSPQLSQSQPWQLSGLRHLAVRWPKPSDSTKGTCGQDPATAVLLKMLPHTQQLQQISLVSWDRAGAECAASVLRELAQLPQLRSIGLPAELLCQQCCCDRRSAAPLPAAVAAAIAAARSAEAAAAAAEAAAAAKAAAEDAAAAAAAAKLKGQYAALEALAVKPSVAVLAFLRFAGSENGYSRCCHGGQQRQTLAPLQQAVSGAAEAAAAGAAVSPVQGEMCAPSTGGTMLAAAAAAAGAGPAARGVARAQLRLLNCDMLLCWADGTRVSGSGQPLVGLPWGAMRWLLDERSTGKGAWGVFGPVREW
jgi:hypothetical protein